MAIASSVLLLSHHFLVDSSLWQIFPIGKHAKLTIQNWIRWFLTKACLITWIPIKYQIGWINFGWVMIDLQKHIMFCQLWFQCRAVSYWNAIFFHVCPGKFGAPCHAEHAFVFIFLNAVILSKLFAMQQCSIFASSLSVFLFVQFRHHHFIFSAVWFFTTFGTEHSTKDAKTASVLLQYA